MKGQRSEVIDSSKIRKELEEIHADF